MMSNSAGYIHRIRRSAVTIRPGSEGLTMSMKRKMKLSKGLSLAAQVHPFLQQVQSLLMLFVREQIQQRSLRELKHLDPR